MNFVPIIVGGKTELFGRIAGCTSIYQCCYHFLIMCFFLNNRGNDLAVPSTIFKG